MINVLDIVTEIDKRILKAEPCEINCLSSLKEWIETTSSMIYLTNKINELNDLITKMEISTDLEPKEYDKLLQERFVLENIIEKLQS